MSIRLVPLVLTAALVLSLGAVTGCGGDDEEGNGGGKGGELTLEEYFQELESLSIEFDDRGSELEDSFDSASVETDEDAINVTQSFLGDTVDVLKDFVDGIDGLNPPAEVEDAHDAAVEAGRDTISLVEGLVDDVGNAESAADLASVFEGLAGIEDFSNACIALQATADDAGIDVDLRCGNGEE